MNKPHDVTEILRGNADRLDLNLPIGQIAARTVRCPGSNSDIEDSAMVLSTHDNSILIAVADGVGGNPGGRTASNTVLKALSKCQSPAKPDSIELRSLILTALEEANHELLNRGLGSATTVAVAEISDAILRAYHVGDSEILVVGQRGKIKLRVVPHSATGFAVEAGLLDEDDAVDHEERHLLLNVVGTADMRIEVAPPVRLATFDTVLLTTDGVLDNLYVDEIAEIIRCGPVFQAAEELCRLTLERMISGSGRDPSKPDDLAIVLFRRTK